MLPEHHFNIIYAGREAHETGFLGHQILFLQNTSTYFIFPFSKRYQPLMKFIRHQFVDKTHPFYLTYKAILQDLSFRQ